MDFMFVEAHSDLDIMLPVSAIGKLPKKLGLLTTVQHAHKLGKLKKALEAKGKAIKLITGSRSRHPGQILGCDILTLPKLSSDIEAYLYIGTGDFHPKEMLLIQDRPVFAYDPLSRKLRQLDPKEVESIRKRERGALLKFLSSTRVGVLITTKPGQQNLEQALRLKQDYPDKEFFFLLFDTIDFSSLENFPFIECFINTACPRIGYDDQINIGKPILNIGNLPKPPKKSR